MFELITQSEADMIIQILDETRLYNLREWAPEHEKMGKGVTLSNDELKVLKELLNSIDI